MYIAREDKIERKISKIAIYVGLKVACDLEGWGNRGTLVSGLGTEGRNIRGSSHKIPKKPNI